MEITLAKSQWGPGKWQEEPDRFEWEYKGFPCLMVRNVAVTGSWCGYVAVPPGHPCYEKEYGENIVGHLNVHGGVTYTNYCSGHVCHVPKPGEPDEVWWIGFDCAHGGDLSPQLNATMNLIMPSPRPSADWETYKDMEYVKKEAEQLADQLEALAKKPKRKRRTKKR